MRSNSFHSSLASDSISGPSYYHQPDSVNAQLPLGVPVRPASGQAVPIQVSGNMLGARARAAEYNAAKAASARQQASQEAEGLKIPRPPPTPLSAFARNPSANRNKGFKTFKPLVLTEEEGSTTSDEQENNNLESPLLDNTEPPRSASLPPPQTAPNVRPDFVRTAQTPHRFNGGPYVPFAPRAMMVAEDSYFSSQHVHMSRTQQYIHYPPNHPTLPAPHQALSAAHIGWFSSPEQYDGSYSYPNAELPPTTPVPETRPRLDQQRDSDGSAAPDTEPEKTQSSQTSPSVVKQVLSGPLPYVFGPDDLSPAKCQVKQQIRERAFQERAEALAKMKMEDSARDVNSTEPPRRPRDEELLRLFKRTTTETSQDQISINAPDLTGERRLSEVGETQSKMQSEHRPENGRKSTIPLAVNEADWPYLGHGSAYYGNFESRNADTKSILGARAENAGERLKHILLEGLKQKAEAEAAAVAAAAVAVKPPPGLPRPKPQKPRMLDSRVEQITNLKFPLVDLDSDEWLDIRPLTEQKRNQMRRIYETVKTCSVSDKYRDTWEDRGGLPRPEFRERLENSKQEFLERRKQIYELADEMQQQWENGGSFRTATMKTEEAKQQAGIVKTVGGIMSALNMQLEDKSGNHYRGSRPYSSVPDYAIRRSTGSDKQGKCTSLFEAEEEADRVVPMRLARDPRFRPQLGEATKPDEFRIPRMFVSRRA